MTSPHLVNYITRDDVDIVLARIPAELRRRARNIYFTDESRAVRTLGWVTRRGRRDITLCSMLPPRVSLQRYMFGGCVAVDFGAPARGQWPPWAVRRKLLYDTLLHELGHLQVIGGKPDAWDGDFAAEGMAIAFANEWRGRLYSEPFDHPDPVHAAPTDDERDTLPYWDSLDKEGKLRLTRIVVGELSPDLTPLGYLQLPVARFLRRLVRRSA